MKKRILGLFLCIVMIVGILPAGLLALPSAAENYTDPNSPYVATTYTQLFNFFAAERTAGKTYYVKLGKDVSYKHYEDGSLVTHGGNVSLDLAGYTISYTDESNFSHRVISGLDGKVIINDSRRYDSSKGEWIEGKIDYVYTVPYNNRNTAALSGSIVMNGGRVVNRTSSDAVHSAYANVFYKDEAAEYSERGSFEMYDGVFEAKTPLYLTALSEVQKISGGVFETKGGVGIEVRHGSAGFYTPEIEKCDILNSSGSSRAFGLKVDFASNYTSSHTAEQAIEDLGKMIPDGTYAFVDGEKQSSVTDGIVSALYKTTGMVYGPAFSSSFVLYPSITLSELRVTLTEPKPGAALSYDAVAPEGNGYVVEAYNDDAWKNGVYWRDEEGEPLPAGSVFEAGKRYTATVSIIPVNKWIYLFADVNTIRGYINGRPATVKKFSSVNYGLTYTFTCPQPTCIDHIDLTIPTPSAGKAISYGCTLPENCGFKLAAGYFNNNDEHWKNCMLWSVDGENLLNDRPNTFKAGKTYTVTIALFKTNDPWFEYVDTADLTATINGMEATVYNAGCIAVSCEITIPDNTIRTLEITVPEPVGGDPIVYDAFVPEDAGYKVKNFSNGYEWEEGVSWSDEYGLLNPQDGNVFGAGVYTVEVWLTLADDEHSFASLSNMTAYVNGHKANVANIAAGEYSVYYTFAVSAPTVDVIEVTIPEPAAGEPVYYTASVPEGVEYTVENYNSGAWKNGLLWRIGGSALDKNAQNYFNSGETYQVLISVVIAPGNASIFGDPDEIQAYVNGIPAETEVVNNENYLVKYTFTVEEPDLCSVYIYLDANDIEYIAGVDVPLGTPFGEVEAPGRDGAFFGGWFTDRALTKPYDPKAPITEDVELFPLWIPTALIRIDEVNITGYKRPTLGQSVADCLAGLSVPDGAHYSIASVQYRLANNTILQDSYVFDTDRTYYLSVALVAEEGYFFDSADKPTMLLGGSAKDVDAQNSGAYNDGAYLSLRSVDFTVEESTVLYGDVNSDGTVNKKDSLALKKYLADSTKPIDLAAADVNGDGVVNKKDSLRLKQWLAGFDVTLGA